MVAYSRESCLRAGEIDHVCRLHFLEWTSTQSAVNDGCRVLSRRGAPPLGIIARHYSNPSGYLKGWKAVERVITFSKLSTLPSFFKIEIRGKYLGVTLDASFTPSILLVQRKNHGGSWQLPTSWSMSWLMILTF